jgi:hypothetical protein
MSTTRFLSPLHLLKMTLAMIFVGSNNGLISGTVKDDKGNMLPGVKVKLLNPDRTVVKVGLQTLLSNFIERKNSGETANTLEHEFASLPQLDKSNKNKRLKPVLCPDKRYRGKIKLHEW